jgi:hypothetical protein
LSLSPIFSRTSSPDPRSPAAIQTIHGRIDLRGCRGPPVPCEARPGGRIADAFALASISINPIIKGTGVKIKLLESLSLGIPTVSTEHGVRGVADQFRKGVICGGEAHDCPVASRLIDRVEPAERMLGDKAYDSSELRDELHQRRTKPVIPNRINRKPSFLYGGFNESGP